MSSPEDRGTAAETFATLMLSRRSCRAFLPEPLPQATITRALEIAQTSASWCNSQPWNVIVTSGAATERFRQAYMAKVGEGDWAANPPATDFPFPSRYEGVYKQRQRQAGGLYYQAVGIATDDRAASARQTLKNFTLFDAPHFLLVTTPANLGVYGAVDCGAWVHNFMIAGESLGFGAIAQGAIAMYSPFVRAHFGLDESEMVVCGVSFGRPDHDAPENAFRVPRAPLAENIRFVDE
jgi:nitroreductase